MSYESEVQRIAFTPNGQLNVTTGDMEAVSFTPDGRIAAGFSDIGNQDVRIWSVETGKELTQLKHDAPIEPKESIVFSPDGKTVTTVSRGTVRVWSVSTGEELFQFNQESQISSVAFSPDSKVLAVASRGSVEEYGIARLWSVENGEELARINHETGINAINFSPDGKLIVTASQDGIARISAIYNEDSTRLNHRDGVVKANFIGSGETFFTASNDGVVRLWSASSSQELLKFDHGNGGESFIVGLSPDGKTIVTGYNLNETVRLWSIDTGKEIGKIEGGKLWAMDFSPDSNYLAMGGEVITASLHSALSGEIITTMSTEGSTSGVSFSPNGKLVAIATDGGTSIWTAPDGEEIFRVGGTYHSDVDFSPNGEIVATGDGAGLVQLWSVQDGEEIARFEHEDFILAVEFSPDGKAISSASQDGTARLWSVTTKEELARFEHERIVNTVVFSPQGDAIATASSDGTARLWSIASGMEISRFNHEDRVNDISFSPDGQILITASEDSTARLWRRSPEVLADTICQRISRNFTASEWVSYVSEDLAEYELICPNRPIHHSVLEQAKKDAKTGNQKRAIALFRRVQYLDPEIDLDPSTIEQERDYRSLSRKLFQIAKAEREAQEASELLGQARKAAYDGKLDEAILLYQEAKNLSPEIDIAPETDLPDDDPTAVARKIAASAKLDEATELLELGQISEAVHLYKQAQEFTDVSVIQWNQLCWLGSLHNKAEEVFFACTNAVTLEPDNVGVLDSRGLARALTGDVEGAIRDFQEFVNARQGAEAEQRRFWIEELKAGRNPFSDQVLESLLND